MKLRGIGPAGQAGHRVELWSRPLINWSASSLRAELFELAEDPRQRLVGVGDGALGEVLALRARDIGGV